MILVSKSEIKLITSLQQKKYRNKLGLFVAEGPKVINELLTSGIILHSLFTTEKHLFKEETLRLVPENSLDKISFLKNANNSVAVFQIPKSKQIIENTLTIALDSIRDPGNLGTIIRLCDWFGVQQLVCSLDTVDCYNPKVVQATMGSIARVNIVYVNLSEYLKESKLPVFGGCMEGASIYNEELPKDAIVVLGNEANGISEKIESMLTNKITIPQFGEQKETESLNVATATAIILSEFKRFTEK